MDSSSEANTVKRTNIRKGKVEIKKVKEKSRRCVTFSKRKQGLFNKVTELSFLCQAEIALVITSQTGKLYACGYPDPDSVIRRYHGCGGGGGGYHHNRAPNKRRFQEGVEALRLKYEATQAKLKEENMHLQAITKAKLMNGLAFTDQWWDLPVDDMGFEQVEEFKNCIQDLKMKLVAEKERKKKKVIDNNSLPPLAVALSPMQSLSDMSFFNEGFKACDYGLSSMVPSGRFRHY